MVWVVCLCANLSTGFTMGRCPLSVNACPSGRPPSARLGSPQSATHPSGFKAVWVQRQLSGSHNNNWVQLPSGSILGSFAGLGWAAARQSVRWAGSGYRLSPGLTLSVCQLANVWVWLSVCPSVISTCLAIGWVVHMANCLGLGCQCPQ